MAKRAKRAAKPAAKPAAKRAKPAAKSVAKRAKPAAKPAAKRAKPAAKRAKPAAKRAKPAASKSKKDQGSLFSGEAPADPASDAYDASTIETLEGLEAVRKRPAMYIGDTGLDGLMHLVWEIVDNAVDEAVAGHASQVDVVLHRDGSIEVADNGRGIPVDTHATGVSALEVVFTELHAGGKFGGGAYAASGGLHGVGASVVNAMSSRLDVSVRRSGRSHSLTFQQAEAGHFHGSTFEPSHELKTARARGIGTTVRFWPDMALFTEEAVVDASLIQERLTEACYLVKGMTVTVADSRPDGGEPFSFVSRGGIADLVDARCGDRRRTCETFSLGGVDTFTEKVPVSGKVTEVEREVLFEAALAWCDTDEAEVSSYVNILPTSSGGTHLAGFEKSLTRAVNNFLLKDYRKLKSLQKTGDHRASKEDVQKGLVAAVKVTFAEPQFRGQTKQQLGTPAMEGAGGAPRLRTAQRVLRAGRRPPQPCAGGDRQDRCGCDHPPRPAAARSHSPQSRPGRFCGAAGQTRRLPQTRTRIGVAAGRGRLRGWAGQTGSRLDQHGGAAVARQDHQRCEVVHPPGTRQH